MKFISNFFILSLLGICLAGCSLKKDTNLKNVDFFLKRNKIELIEERFGLMPQPRKRIEFIRLDDSVLVTLSDVDVILDPPRTVMIDLDIYKEIETGLHCLVLNHQKEESPSGGCIAPSANEYYLVRGFNKMRLFDSNTTCNFDKLLLKYLDYPEFEE